MKKTDQETQDGAAGQSRREALKHLTWAAPAVIATASVRARAAAATTNPCPPDPCLPDE